ncbi:hypothetical protein ACM46_11000 [Chryseobacterium angstadtii]|uniref:Uncharacterized protein n=1 Tax=Chryseobacterium angstadtii TaxID=558151 RepID=A0A0J7L6R2_9FLAO|nr:hypothetical protein ACM46_11000 [Chryseobacterium angstadtii]
MMKHNNFIFLQKVFGITLCLSVFIILADCSHSSTNNESEAIKTTFLVTCITIATIFIVLYISKKIKRKE